MAFSYRFQTHITRAASGPQFTTAQIATNPILPRSVPHSLRIPITRIGPLTRIQIKNAAIGRIIVFLLETVFRRQLRDTLSVGSVFRERFRRNFIEPDFPACDRRIPFGRTFHALHQFAQLSAHRIEHRLLLLFMSRPGRQIFHWTDTG
ncbi:TPA: hypothetical protein ACU967_006139 [Burkholderia contaminans]|uniref:hypothetical protein n=1 Tax=Burkholderia TaxID=32008 RepID=UPI0012D8E0BC|nr:MULTISPECIES: hypothetical protein [Burkholderia]MBM6430733.1 hypothetical protein [Burkholderia contaminans]MBR8015185.1 hypothetical protein [Burkholderia vietnamiensis]MCA7881033.1 hypothetical protein [Burkholderia contaminans]MCB4348989.1 hypothetical protein [Burkholderia vietnamiensis]MDN8026090.1 hypothetical protein [Burkholderia contaminans]